MDTGNEQKEYFLRIFIYDTDDSGKAGTAAPNNQPAIDQFVT